MQIAIAGGHGKIALILTRLLSDRGDRVVSMVRDPDQAGDVTEAGGEPVVVDLEHSSDDQLDRVLTGCDAVVFAAGAGPGSGAARKESVDYAAAVSLIEAARRTGVRRYVMISASGADPDAAGDEVFAVYLRAKGRADRELASSGLDFTIIKPVGLTDQPGTGQVATNEPSLTGQVSREDVAAVVAEALGRDDSIGATFRMSAGTTPIPDAIGSVS
ncbi:MAG: SDR family oxidoreductase [Solirubrobacterales bacterium]|nr:SDR family oxidoreductase [Solirubrobacterales bacterium]